MNLLYSDVEDGLRAAVRAALADRSPHPAVLARIEGAQPYDPALWRLLAAELGVAGLLVPERLGGQGASAREAAVVLEELGRAVAPTPFLGSAVLAVSALLCCDTADPAVAGLLGRLASGRAAGALTVPLAAVPGSAFPGSVRAEGNDTAGWRLAGRVTTVADALGADVLVVAALGPDGPALFEVAAADADVAAFSSLDLTRPLSDVALAAAPARRLPAADPAAALDGALLTGAGLLASEQVGVAQWCLDETVRHLGQRHQFGRVLGSFQALKHRLADVWLDVLSARAAARAAADALARDPAAASADTAVAVAVAASYASEAAVRAAEEAVQLHGGIGMTWEHPAHLYLKRAKADAIALGTPGRHRARLAELVDLPAPA
ncbi:acyl-CoA dehydrogenase family protein [Actinacidiphila yeochonensis]|uniref:acyl-CoA dehydrogenase family protein n=1 Tax=Actinacidiphila yeochonensis TaxID=89050 RepID=UPI000562EDB7|nr:acyl-CoA dehydrogenase family protein [Actinacidiphila yeochonensis]